MGDQILDNERKKEFRRQQDRLKMMAPDSEKKIVSADAMIDSLLQKSDTFKKVRNDLPPWLLVDSPTSSPFYSQIWEMVKASNTTVDTAKISQLLLTSGLHPDVLGFIWNLANVSTPGQLTKQELFIVLALVGLAQSGCAFNNTSVLNLVPSPPIPRLIVPFQPVFTRTPLTQTPVQGPILQNNITPMAPVTNVPMTNLAQPTQQPARSMNIEDEFDDFQSVPAPTNAWQGLSQGSLLPSQTKPTTINSSTPYDFSSQDLIGSTPSPPIKEKIEETSSKSERLLHSAESAADHSEADFSDFQSADQFDTSIVQPVKVSLPKLSSFIKVSPESERRLRYLAQPESLTALPESKISSRNQVQTMPSIAVVGASRSVGNRLANHGGKLETSRHHKHTKIKPIVSATAATVLPSEEIFPKCMTSKSFILKETKIPSLDMESPDLTRTIEIPLVGAMKETTLPVVSKEPELFAVEGDKYSALRDLSCFNAEPAVDEDFGDFLSADAQVAERNSASEIKDSPSDRTLATESLFHEIVKTNEDSNSVKFSAFHSVRERESKNNVDLFNDFSSLSLTSNLDALKPENNPLAGVTAESRYIPTNHPTNDTLTFQPNYNIADFDQENSGNKENLVQHAMEGPSDEFQEMQQAHWGDNEKPGDDKSIPHLENNQKPVDSYNSLHGFSEYGFLRKTDEHFQEKPREVEETNSGESGSNENFAKPNFSMSGFNENNFLKGTSNEEKPFQEETNSGETLANHYKPGPANSSLLNSNDDDFPKEIIPGCNPIQQASMVVNQQKPAQPNYDVHDFSEDDFGDFVAPALDEAKSAHSSTPSYDFGHRDSWSSLEFMAGSREISREASILGSDITQQIKEEDTPFQNAEDSMKNDFQTSKQENTISSRCLQCCCEILRDAVAIFDRVTDKMVMTEVFQTAQARGYINNLSIVHSIADKVLQNVEDAEMSSEMSFLWGKISDLIIEYSIPIEKYEFENVGLYKCVVCNGAVGETACEQNGAKCHSSCGNLWINCVEKSLPGSLSSAEDLKFFDSFI